MKTKNILLLIVLIIPFLGHSQVQFVQYFEGASNNLFINIDSTASNVWQIGPPQKIIFDRAATLPNAMVTDTINNYPVNNTSSFSFYIDPQSFWSGNILAFQWKQKLDMDSGYDGGIIEFSINGNTWQNAFNNPYVYNFYGFDPVNKDTLPSGEYAFSGTDSTWKNIWLCFDASWLSFNDSLMFRFTFKSDSIDNNKEGWLIDNFLVSTTIIHTLNAAEPEQYMTVSPSPTTGRVNIDTKKIDEFHIIEKIELVNIEGKVVQEWGMSPTKFYVDIGNHPNGVYFLKIKTNIKSGTFKILLER